MRLARGRRAAAAVLLAALGAGPSHAQLWEITGNAGLREEYNTNWQLTSLPHDSVWITSLFGTVEAVRTTEVSRTALAATLSPYVVIGDEGANRVDARLAADAARAFERDVLAINALFLRDSTLLTELQQTGIALEQVPRNFFTVAPSWTHQLAPRWRTRLGYSFAATRYGQDSAGLVDNNNQVGSATLTYAWSERIDTFVTGSYSLFETRPAANRTTSTQLGLGVSGRFTERLTGSLAVSGYHLDVRTTQSFLICPGLVQLCQLGLLAPIPVQADLSRSDNGYAFDGNLTWQATERTTASASGGQSLQPSGSGAVYVVRRAAFGLRHDFTETVSGSLGAAVLDSELAGAQAPSRSEQRTYAADASVTWRATRTWRFEAGVRGTRVDYPTPAVDVSSLAVFLSAAYVWDGIPLSR